MPHTLFFLVKRKPSTISSQRLFVLSPQRGQGYIALAPDPDGYFILPLFHASERVIASSLLLACITQNIIPLSSRLIVLSHLLIHEDLTCCHRLYT